MSSQIRNINVNPTPKALVNFEAQGGQAMTVLNPSDFESCAQILSGALTANTLATQINYTGGGVIGFLRVQVLDATARTLRCRLTLDGVVVFDATSAANSVSAAGMQVIGFLNNGAQPGVACMDEIHFAKSFKFEVASSLTETGTLKTLAQYNTY